MSPSGSGAAWALPVRVPPLALAWSTAVLEAESPISSAKLLAHVLVTHTGYTISK